jgi:hypothetical protein
MKETKIKQVHEHLLKYGEIDTWTAIQKYGATRLSAIIYRLRNEYDMKIETHERCVKDRNNNTCNYALYKLVDNEIEKIMKEIGD